MCLTIFKIMRLKKQIKSNMGRQFKLVAKITDGYTRDGHMVELELLDEAIKNQVKRLKELETPLLN
tara:strand:- start:1368 stop:1565 length:198 start_codon:yes stop_codon:yes gene_type:complete